VEVVQILVLADVETQQLIAGVEGLQLHDAVALLEVGLQEDVGKVQLDVELVYLLLLLAVELEQLKIEIVLLAAALCWLAAD
jgi:hypothetical protein